MVMKKEQKQVMRNQTMVRVQQSKSGQNIITLPQKIASQWLNVTKGDRIEFAPHQGKICISKVEE